MYDSHDDEIELIDILKVLWKRKRFILSVVLFTLVVASIWIWVKYPKTMTSSAIVSLTFPGIEKHTYPDGTSFSKNDLIRPEITSKATETFDSQHSIPVNTLFYNGIIPVTVEPVIPESIQKQIKDAENKGTVFEYYPNVFKIIIMASHQDSIQDEDLNMLLTEIVKTYTADFERIYSAKETISMELPADFIDTYEFVDIVDVLRKVAEQLQQFLDKKVKTAGFFKSKTSGMMFADIKRNTEIVLDVYIKRIEAVINNSNLSRNKAALINVYQNKIKALSLLQQKKEKEADVSYKLLADMGISKQNSSSPGQGTINNDSSRSSGLMLDSSIIANIKKDDYVAYLLKTIIDAETQSINNAVEIEFLKKDIEDINKKQRDEDQNAGVQKDINDIAGKLAEYTRQANEINAEYLEGRLKKSVQLVRNPLTTVSRGRNVLLILALAGIASLFLSIFAAFFIEYIDNNKKLSESDKKESSQFRAA